jgi:hypothetical protein
MRSDFEKAYEPNPHKSPFTEVRFNEEKQIYEPLNPPLDRVARSLNAAWYGYRIRQTEVDELQKRVDAAQKLIDDWNFGGVHIFDLLDELEQALKGGDE